MTTDKLKKLENLTDKEVKAKISLVTKYEYWLKQDLCEFIRPIYQQTKGQNPYGSIHSIRSSLYFELQERLGKDLADWTNEVSINVTKDYHPKLTDEHKRGRYYKSGRFEKDLHEKYEKYEKQPYPRVDTVTGTVNPYPGCLKCIEELKK